MNADQALLLQVQRAISRSEPRIVIPALLLNAASGQAVEAIRQLCVSNGLNVETDPD